jgi:hypothetical protein
MVGHKDQLHPSESFTVEGACSDPGVENNTQNKDILISGGPSLFETAKNLHLYWLLKLRLVVGFVKVAQSDCDMIDPRVSRLGDVVRNCKWLEYFLNTVQGQSHSMCCMGLQSH